MAENRNPKSPAPSQPAASASPSTAAVPKADEEKHAKFVELLESRMTRTLNDLRMIANLGASAYVRKQEEVDYIAKTLRDEVEAAIAAIQPNNIQKVQKSGFKLLA